MSVLPSPVDNIQTTKYERKPLEFKKYPTKVIVRVKQPTIMLDALPMHKNAKQAQSLIAQILMTNNKLNPAQKASLQKAKELLNA